MYINSKSPSRLYMQFSNAPWNQAYAIQPMHLYSPSHSMQPPWKGNHNSSHAKFRERKNLQRSTPIIRCKVSIRMPPVGWFAREIHLQFLVYRRRGKTNTFLTIAQNPNLHILDPGCLLLSRSQLFVNMLCKKGGRDTSGGVNRLVIFLMTYPSLSCCENRS